MKFGSVDEFLEFWTETNPPTIALQRMAPPESYAQLLTRARSLVEASNESVDGGVTLSNAYVMALARPRLSPSAPRG